MHQCLRLCVVILAQKPLTGIVQLKGMYYVHIFEYGIYKCILQWLLVVIHFYSSRHV